MPVHSMLRICLSPSAWNQHVAELALHPHRIWTIPELLWMIIDELSRSDSCSMAAVSHAFWGIAVRRIWENLPVRWNNDHILGIIPPQIRAAIEEEPTGTTLLAQGEGVSWDRFEIYASRIRGLVLEFGTSRNTETVLQAIMSGTTQAFPNLRQLSITLCDSPLDPQIVPWVASGENITHFEIDFWQGVATPLPPTSENDVISTAIDILHLTHPLRLKGLAIRAVSDPLGGAAIALEEVTTIVSSQQELRVLEIHDFDDQFLGPWEAASRLPNLTRVSFRAPSTPFPLRSTAISPLQGRRFPSLLEVDAELTVEALPILLSSISSPHLHTLDLLVETVDNRLELGGLGGGLGGIGRFGCLSSAWIDFPRTMVTWGELNPLLACSSMKSVFLQGYCLSALIGDEEVLSMAQAWPQLTSLCLSDLTRRPSATNGERGRLYAPAASLQSLSALALHCPLLQMISMSVDACGMEAIGPIRATGDAVDDLEFPCSFAGMEEEKIAVFIARTWPNQLEGHDDELGDWEPGLGDPYVGSTGAMTGAFGRRWVRIWTRVRELIEGSRGTDA